MAAAQEVTALRVAQAVVALMVVPVEQGLQAKEITVAVLHLHRLEARVVAARGRLARLPMLFQVLH